MNTLVTGADGFVGQWLCRALLTAGHEVTGTHYAAAPVTGTLTAAERDAVRWVPLDLTDEASISRVGGEPVERVVHLAGLASAAVGARDPGLAWRVNAAGTAQLLHHLAQQEHALLVLVVSTSEVYGAGKRRLRRETDPLLPRSAYAASKAGAELAAGDLGRRTPLRILVARPFPHTGPGQTTTFMAPAFAARIRAARASGATAVPTGNLEPIRELMDVRDVVDAYLALLERGAAGEIYNVARGEGVSVAEVFTRLARLIGAKVTAEPDPMLHRPADIPHLVGSPAKIFAATGWRARRTLDETLQDLVDAQTD
ncbi:MAG: NAD-dependent epimerase/dehydratase family protein [Gemmatimonadales bacterium]